MYIHSKSKRMFIFLLRYICLNMSADTIVQTTFQELSVLYDRVGRDKQEREHSLSKVGYQNPAFLDELDKKLSNRIKDSEEQIKAKLRKFARYPPHFSKHLEKLNEFYSDGCTFSKSVMIMTKFSEGKTKLDTALSNIIKITSKTIEECGFTPRIASSRNYYPTLWDNVELYLLACGQGIAIVESRYKPELNPNVALEWGFMRALGKDVLFLMEKDFSYPRADWEGFLKESFIWDKPANEIKHAVHKWLKDRKEF